MKLTFLNTPMGTFTPTHSGAIATIIWEVARRAKLQGTEITVVSRSSEVEPYRDFNTVFVDYPPTPTSGAALLLRRAQRKLAGWTHLCQGDYARRVARAIREHGLHEQKLVMFNDPEMAVFLRRQFPKMFILHWFQNQLVCKPAARRDFRHAINVTAGVSDFTSRWIRDYYAMEEGSVQTLYNAVDVERFAPASVEPGLPVVINFVGRTGIEKAPDLLLAAARKLAGRTKNFSLQIVGSNHWGRFEMDDYQRKLQSLVADVEAAGICIRRTGHVDRPSLPAEIRKAHIHVVPSRWDEPFGLVTLEGMASGLATIGSATGGTPELIGEAGLLFDRDSVDGLAARLAELVENEENRRQVAARCRRRAEQFTWDRTWNRLAGMLAA